MHATQRLIGRDGRGAGGHAQHAVRPADELGGEDEGGGFARLGVGVEDANLHGMTSLKLVSNRNTFHDGMQETSGVYLKLY